MRHLRDDTLAMMIATLLLSLLLSAPWCYFVIYDLMILSTPPSPLTPVLGATESFQRSQGHAYH